MATGETLGAFQWITIVVIDGTCFDVPDSDENASFDRPQSSWHASRISKVRLVIW